jgi:hypothetical protein
MPHLVKLHELDIGGNARLRQGRRFCFDPFVNSDFAYPEQPRDHPVTHIAHAVEQNRQRLHRRWLAARRRVREVAAAIKTPVTLMAAHDPVLHIRRAVAPLA